MLNFWKFIIGLVAFIIGIILFIWITKARRDGDKGGFGAHVNIYTASIGFIIIGIVMMFKELIKIF